MNRKLIIISILAATMIIMLPISSVLGINVIKNKTQENMNNSPLFLVKVSGFKGEKSQKLSTTYLGKDKFLNIFLTKRSNLIKWNNQAIRMINEKPFILIKTFEKIENNLQLSEILETYEFSIKDIEEYMFLIKNDPILFERQVNKAVQILGDNILSPIYNPEPVGFSGQPGCLIGFFIILPIIIMIGTMIATFTIITCLNINSCFEKIMQNILEGFAQGVTIP